MKLSWDDIGTHFYETGVDHGTLYPITDTGSYGKGVAWNGLTAVNETPSGGEASAVYADNIKYLNLMSVEELGATIEAYTYPDEFAECDGSAEVAEGVFIGQQTRKKFGFVYRTKIGNDETDAKGYKLHILYGCMASPSEKSHSTVNDSPEATSMSWTVTTTPVAVAGYDKPTASIEIDSTKTDAAKLKAIEDALFGTEENEPKLLMPDEIITMCKASA